jgi:acetyl-CoA carboxylase biotin carboxyl carrier protein
MTDRPHIDPLDPLERLPSSPGPDGGASSPPPAEAGDAARGGAGEPPRDDAAGRDDGGAASSGPDAAGSGATSHEDPPPPSDPGDAALLALIDRLAGLLDRSELTELEVQVGGTGLVLRKPVAVAPPAMAVAAAGPAAPAGGGSAPAGGGSDAAGPTAPAAPSRPSVKAPLTGIWYAAPSVGTAPYVSVGGEVAAGQVIGLIEAMKLFNEIKSDLSGRVVKIHAENGKLVKARQPLIEVDPL